ncbi:SU10 major capsid protein [Mycolicibacterium wolinskyi]|uniref:SU10 major capsid protein n=1 Tax=Mycolicibacterium wolinskyi TaxID=59750 RepID=UPI003917980A
MAGITGIGTTFNEPNYHGELFALTPVDTPLLSMAGGLGGGKQTTATEFEWQAYDLREPEIRPRKEGDDAPNPEARVRKNVKNVVQIFHEAVGTSYTKQATAAQLATTQTAPFNSADGLGFGNPVGNEHTWQVAQSLVQIARDVNYSFWHARKNVPEDNTEARQMAGLLSVVTTNKSFAIPEVSATTATDTVTAAAHGMANGDMVVFTDVGTATGIRLDRSYFVVSQAAGTFKVAAAAGGAPITLGTATVKYVQVSGGATTSGGGTGVSVDRINAFVQGIFDNGGLTQGDTRVLFVPSIQKTRITKAYATAYGSNSNGAIGTSAGHTVGGVAVDRITTDFGDLYIAIDRALPKDAVAAVSMEVIDPVFLSIPGKGVLFEEELAKTGATDKTQIYGEIGLKYGHETSHGVLRGLAAGPLAA